MRALVALIAVLLLLCAYSVWEAEAHTGCHTEACENRVQIKHMKQVIAPHKAWLKALRMCESGGDYANRSFHRGAYQFTWDTWRRAGGKPADPADATPLRQDYTVIRWANIIGWANVGTSAGWPNCP